MPLMMSFINCVPTSSVPIQPISAKYQAFTFWRNTYADMSCQLPGGRIAEIRMPTSFTAFSFQGTLHNAQRSQQDCKERQEHIERHRLRYHTALRKESGQRSK